MRTTSSLVLIAAWLAASGCMHEQTAEPAQPSVAETPPVETAPPETATEQPPMTQPEMQPPGTQAPQGPAAKMNPHDIVTTALACVAAPMGVMGSAQMQMGMAPMGAAECDTVASEANVPAQALRMGDANAIKGVRDVVEQSAKSANLSEDTKSQLLGLYDRGTAAAREAGAAAQVAARYATGAQPAIGGGPTGPHGGGAAHKAPAGHRGAAAPVTPIGYSEATALRAHDKLRDLAQFARSANAGPLASEAEGVAWLLASERFMKTQQLPSRLKVLAAEPLFDTLLGVPTPPAVEGDPSKIPANLWSKYLDAAAKSVREAGASGVSGQWGQQQGAYGGGPTSAPRTGQTGRTQAGPQKDLANWREVVSFLEQRMNTIAQRIPQSDLKQALSSYAEEIRTQAIGGGPVRRPPTMPMTPPSGGMAPPSGGMAPPSGGMAPPSGTQRGAPPSGTVPAPGGAPSPTTPTTPPTTPPGGTSPSYP